VVNECFFVAMLRLFVVNKCSFEVIFCLCGHFLSLCGYFVTGHFVSLYGNCVSLCGQ